MCIYFDGFSLSLSQILREGGMFICRVYSLLGRFTAGLFFIMYKLFQEVCTYTYTFSFVSICIDFCSPGTADFC